MPELPLCVQARSAERLASGVLLEARVPTRKQSGKPDEMAGEEPRLFPGRGAPGPLPRLAASTSGLLENFVALLTLAFEKTFPRQ